MNQGTALGLSLSIAAVVGLLGGFFLGGPALIADGPTDERTVVVAILAVVLGMTGFGVGFLAPQGRNIAPWILCAPTVLLSVFILSRERNILVTALLLVAGAIGFSLAGVWLGARTRLRGAPADRTQATTP